MATNFLAMTKFDYDQLDGNALRNLNNLEYGAVGGWCVSVDGGSLGTVAYKRGRPVGLIQQLDEGDDGQG